MTAQKVSVGADSRRLNSQFGKFRVNKTVYEIEFGNFRRGRQWLKRCLDGAA